MQKAKKKSAAFYFFICYIAYSSVYIARLNLSAVSSALDKNGIMTNAQIGIMGSIFFIVFSVGRLINGYLGDKIKSEFLMGAGLSIIGLSNIFIGASLGNSVVLVLWGLNAFGQSMLWGAVTKTVLFAYGTEKSKKPMSYIVTSTAVGSVLGLLLGALSVKYLTLNAAFYLPGAIAIVSGIVVLLCIRTEVPSAAQGQMKIFDLIKDKRILSVMIPVVLHGAIKDNIQLWSAKYFVDKFHFDISYAVVFAFAIPITAFVGRIIYNIFYPRLHNNEHKVAVLGFTVVGACAVLLSIKSISVVPALVLLALISMAINIVNTSYLSIFPVRFADNNAVSLSGGIMDLFTYAGSGISSAVYGTLIQNFGYESMYLSWILLSVLSVATLAFVVRKTFDSKEAS